MPGDSDRSFDPEQYIGVLDSTMSVDRDDDYDVLRRGDRDVIRSAGRVRQDGTAGCRGLNYD